MKHAPLGGSTASIWKNCPGAGHLMAVAPNFETEPMKRGTAMHKAAEQILKGEKMTIELTEDEMAIVQTYCNQVLDMVGDGVLFVEDRINIRENICFGTADAVIHHKFPGGYTIIDFKTGKTKVKAEKNEQLMFLSLSCETGTKVRHCIIQPKVYAEPQFYDVTEAEIDAFDKEVESAIEGFLETPSRTVVGKWCSKCKARGFCPTKNGMVAPPQAEVSW